MTVWAEIQDETDEVAKYISTTDEVFAGLELGMTIMPITCATSFAAKRLTFIKMAAVAALGALLADAEMEADNE